MKTYYITTPIYYLNDKFHIGHTYTTVAADTMARYKKARGYDVRFITGTDEHGRKVEREAQANGVSPQAHVDRLADLSKTLWQVMNIEYDIFLRTTDPAHTAAVSKIFTKLYQQGDIYKGTYEGLYCIPCEALFTERQLVGGNCPDCGRPVEKINEECYFFRLSKYQDRLTKHFEDNPEFVLPLSSRKEMINNFLKPGLEDLCVSRTTFKWGVPVEFDPDHVIYVWIDALPNYITALGYLSDDDSAYRKYWPADLHLMSREIVRFHTIIWPALLMALDEPLPKQVFVHGWWQVGGERIAKSKGNAVDPIPLAERYGVDALRYYLLRETTFGQDGNFTFEGFAARFNAELANDLGNLLSRTVGMIDKYFGGALTETAPAPNGYDADLEAQTTAMVSKVEKNMDHLMFSDALSEIWQVVRRANKYIDENQPWVLAREEGQKDKLSNVLYHLAETLRAVAIVIAPVMPNTPAVIRAQLGIGDPALWAWDSAKTFGLLPRAVRVTKGPAAFPRIETK